MPAGVMRLIIHIAMLLGLCVGCSVQPPTRPYDPQAARSNIVAALPPGWSIISAPREQKRFTTEYFTDPRTEAFLLVGPQSNYIDWIDRAGGSHREHLAKECLYIWLVPGDFKPQFPRFPSEPWGGAQLYSSRAIRAYGYTSHYIADTNRMDTIIKEATSISSPEIRISWSSWQRDIGASLKQ
jgi:hypothetical protein